MVIKPLLQVSDLKKSYGKVVAIDNVSFEVVRGEIFGLLGPNGAGKTTTIGCICGLLRPDRGHIAVGGVDVLDRPLAAKRKLGVIPQDLGLYDELSVEQNLLSFGGLFGLGSRQVKARIQWCLEFVQLDGFRQRKVSELSGGMKRRLNLAIALLHDPELVLADEPTVGVDPQSRNHIFDNIEALAQGGKAVIYTTHYMEEVERLCQRAAIIDQGKVVALDTVPALLNMAKETRRVRLGWTGGMPDKKIRLGMEEKFSPSTLSLEGAELHLAFSTDVPITEMVAWLAEQGTPVAELSMERPTLEDAFLKLTGRRLRDQ